MPEDYSYTTPTPEGEATVNPIYSTSAPTLAPTTPWVPPANYLSLEDLQDVQAKLTNEFQMKQRQQKNIG